MWLSVLFNSAKYERQINNFLTLCFVKFLQKQRLTTPRANTDSDELPRAVGSRKLIFNFLDGGGATTKYTEIPFSNPIYGLSETGTLTLHM